jgi:putative chitinase
MLTAALIQRFAPHARKDIADGLVEGWPAIYAAGINTPLRLAHFMTQLAVESSGLTRLEENLNYTTASRLHEVWPSRFPTVGSAAKCVRNPQALAEKVYGGRHDLGNVKAGDGWAYRGGGLIQTTGRANYREAGFEADPDGLRHMPGALKAALVYWAKHGLNKYADRDDVVGLRKAVQGGSQGLHDAQLWLIKAKGTFTSIRPPAPQEPVQRQPADLAISQPPASLTAPTPLPEAVLGARPGERLTVSRSARPKGNPMDRLRTMNPEQIAALFRTLLQFIGGIGVAYGVMTETQLASVSSGLMTVLVTFWGIWARSDTNLIASAANVPAVHTVVADSDVAKAIPATNVVPPVSL